MFLSGLPRLAVLALAGNLHRSAARYDTQCSGLKPTRRSASSLALVEPVGEGGADRVDGAMGRGSSTAHRGLRTNSIGQGVAPAITLKKYGMENTLAREGNTCTK